MRPRSSVQSVLLFNLTNNDGSWIPTKVEVDSWVTLTAGRNGGHAKDSKKHGGNGSMDGSYKARVLKFKFSPGLNTVSQVLVQHAYMWRQLDLDPTIPMTIPAACNCKTFTLITIFINLRLSLVLFLKYGPQQHGLKFGSSYLNYLDMSS